MYLVGIKSAFDENIFCGRRIMVIILAFQAEDAGSIPVARSQNKK